MRTPARPAPTITMSISSQTASRGAYAVNGSVRYRFGVRANRWRILVGDDAHVLDELVRSDPEAAYEPSFMERIRSRGAFGFIGR